MSLYDKAFEKATWQLVHAKLRASEALWAEYRAVRKSWHRSWFRGAWLTRVLFLFAIALLTAFRSKETTIAVITLWTFGTVFYRAGQLFATLFLSPSLGMLGHYPISDREIMRLHILAFLEVSVWSVADFSIGYLVLLWKTPVGLDLFGTAVVLGGVHWLFVLAMAFNLLAFGPRRVFYPAGMGAIALIVVVLMSGPRLQGVVDFIASVAMWIPPLGWATVGAVPDHGWMQSAGVSVVAASLMALFPFAYRRICSGFALTEGMLVPRQHDENQDISNSTTQANPAPAAAKKTVISLPKPLNWHRCGVMERFVALLLTSRERTVAELLVGGTPGWSKSMRRLVLFFGVAVAACWFFQVGVSIILNNFVFIWIGVAAAHTHSTSSWRGLARSHVVAQGIPAMAYYPMTFWEIARVVGKVQFVQSLAYSGVLGIGLLLLYGLPDGRGLLVLKIGVAVLVAQPVLLVAAFESGGNALKGWQGYPVLLVGVVLVAGLMTGFLVSDWRLALAGAFVASVSSVGALLMYGRWFERSRLDLLPVKNSGVF